ncbi:ion channel [Paracoccus sp. 1_MG-2023]|uniref:ion channel n=1 Tax=unclassified Paracoccus (in: a-proteobacteria) TaxID=2688777 RepID=UPI001C094460|nr:MULTISPECIES: ion channel [unclassified Paracoccus (in: a-proteobacteria)]MBU2956933.1 potassium channel family protein [Paracoccus sp. C2R09]MDO6668131.1 ion channel [Paracoccus sp. 1_MG-2023]
MTGQILLGSLLMMGSIAIAGFWIWTLEWTYARHEGWLLRAPHRPKLILIVVASSLAVLAMVTMSVWLWAVTFHILGIFSGFEEAMYFALVTFTTLGYGDVLMPLEWRILGGLAAANGLLSFGLMTALMVESLRHVRVRQIAFMKERP